MSKEIRVPQMGESIREATVASVRKKTGDVFNAGEVLFDLETDKVTLEVPAPVAGRVLTVKKNAGDIVNVDDLLLIFEEVFVEKSTDSKSDQPINDKAGESIAADKTASQNDILKELSPGGRRFAVEHNIDVSKVEASGKKGNITKEDLVLYENQSHSQTKSDQKDYFANHFLFEQKERETIIPMSRLRQKIAERLLLASQSTAMLTTFNEVDMHAAMEMRSRYKDIFKEKHGVGLGFMSFFVKAVLDA